MASWRQLCFCFLLLSTNLPAFQQSRTEPKNNIPDSLQLFTKEIFRSIGYQGRNAIISPVNLFTALSITAMGAKGYTLEQIQQTLRLPSDMSYWKRGMTSIMSSTKSIHEKDVHLDVANFLWVPRGVTLKNDFARSAQEIFQTRIRDADFSRPEEVRQLVNRRIRSITRGHVNELLPRGAISQETRILLANALYFKGLWLYPFNQSETYPEPFFPDEGRSFKVPMMHISGTFQGGILDDLNARAILLPYKDIRFGLLCVLPDRNYRLDDLEKRLFNSAHTPTSLLRRMIQRDVNVSLPKFKMQFAIEMSQIFQKMGIEDLFADEADLSGMSSTASSAGLKVSHLYHQATIEIGEGGAEASAASGLEITPLMGGVGNYFGPMDFRADRPFLFYLIDRDNENIPLFVGRVNEPTQNHAFDNNRINNIKHDSLKNRPVLVNRNENNELSKPMKFGDYRPAAVQLDPQYQHHQAPHANRPSSLFGYYHDTVVFPAIPSYHNYRHSYHRTAEVFFSADQSVQTKYPNAVIFPDDHFDRFKRHPSQPEQVTNATGSPNRGEEEGIGTRLRDPFWFSKPTTSEVIVPVAKPSGWDSGSNNQPDLSSSSPSVQTPSSPSFANGGGTAPSSLIFGRPAQESTSTVTTTTVRPSSSSSPTLQNIFHALTVPPARNPPSSSFSNNNNNGWNISGNVNGIPGFPPLPTATSPSLPPDVVSTPPAFLVTSSPWQGHANHPLPPFLHSGSPVFFPEFRLKTGKSPPIS